MQRYRGTTSSQGERLRAARIPLEPGGQPALITSGQVKQRNRRPLQRVEVVVESLLPAEDIWGPASPQFRSTSRLRIRAGIVGLGPVSWRGARASGSSDNIIGLPSVGLDGRVEEVGFLRVVALAQDLAEGTLV